jgi:ABC-2 type transport system ATP-binding protein
VASTPLAIRCTGLSRRFGEFHALEQLDLSVPTGVTFGLIGPNGAGKTTLIRLLLGLLQPSEGAAEVLGHRVPSPAVLQRLGYMPQEPAVYLDLTVDQNLTLWGRLAGLTPTRRAERATEVLRLVRLEDRRRGLAGELSGGMRRRLSFAAALLADPDLLLLDEPTVGVEPELRAELWEYFHRLTTEGKSVLITTHYMEEASRCDRVALLHAGRLLAEGTAASLKETTGTADLEAAFLHLVRTGGAR